MGEVLLGSWKAYANSVYSPKVEPLALDDILPSSIQKDEAYAEVLGETPTEEHVVGAVDGDQATQNLPAEDDADVPDERWRRSIRSPMARRGWLFSSGYKPSARDSEIQRQYLPMPKRVISPWCTNWEGRELNEMVLFNAFGYPSESCFVSCLNDESTIMS